MLINVMISHPVGPKSNFKLIEIFETPLYKTGVRNNPLGMDLAYSDQVSLIIHIPISVYISSIVKNKKVLLPLSVLRGYPIILLFTDSLMESKNFVVFYSLIKLKSRPHQL